MPIGDNFINLIAKYPPVCGAKILKDLGKNGRSATL
jgi:hypothetical protein